MAILASEFGKKFKKLEDGSKSLSWFFNESPHYYSDIKL